MNRKVGGFQLDLLRFLGTEVSLVVLQGIMSSQLSSLLFLVVGLSMAITPWLAAGGQLLASRFEQQDVRSLLPAECEVCRSKSMCIFNGIFFNSMFIADKYYAVRCRLMICKITFSFVDLAGLARYVWTTNQYFQY